MSSVYCFRRRWASAGMKRCMYSCAFGRRPCRPPAPHPRHRRGSRASRGLRRRSPGTPGTAPARSFAAAAIWSHCVRRLSRSHCSSSTDAADARRTHDGAHSIGDLQLAHHLTHLIAFLPLDPARDSAGARIVRHEDQKATGEADEGRERCTLVAAFLLLDLDQQFLPFGRSSRMFMRPP